MVHSYKKRFVIITVAMIGLILTVVFSFLGFYVCRDKIHTLENTMNQALKPWNSQTFGQLEADSAIVPKTAENGQIKPDEKREGRRYDFFGNERIDNDSYTIATYVYDPSDGSVTVVTDADFIKDNELSEIISAVVDRSENYEKLKDYGLVYFKEQPMDSGVCKIALTRFSFFMTSFFKSLGVLVFFYLVLILAFVIVSKKLSSIAAKPMEEAIELEKKFVANVSHDLKTPITIILANNSILKSSPDSTVGDQMQWIESTDTASRDMLRMINEMLTFSLLEAEEHQIIFEKINASSCAERCVLQFESVAYDRNIRFDSDIDSDVYISATRDYTDRIFNSIIENAFKYEPNGGSIFTSLKIEKKKAVFTVRNYGSYISSEDLPHIFERFYRADKTRNEKKGHGLGLPIVMQITKHIGAKISVKSSVEEGTVFTVVFDISEK